MNTAHGRIQKDVMEINSQQNLDQPPLYARPVEERLDNVDAMIVGPPDTPYEFGFFKFEVKFPSTYPNVPPRVNIVDTHGVRFNPNLYATGKVCLSILGTWSGESEDEWRSSYSLSYVLSAVQSLIMNSTPYHNEPGYDKVDGARVKQDEVDAYTQKIKHEVLRVAVCEATERALNAPHEPFSSPIKHLFRLFYQNYLRRASENEALNGKAFQMIAFEYHENQAAGKFNYSAIQTALRGLKQRLDAETEEWRLRGKEVTAKGCGRRYYQLLEENQRIKSGRANYDGLSAGPVAEDNLFYWNASIFGPEGSPWEGGIYNLELVYSEDDDLPRVRFITRMHHPHITAEGAPYMYTLARNNREPVFGPLLCLQQMLKQPPNPSPATHVNKEAADQCFSKDEAVQTAYRRTIQRCVRDSIEG